MRPWTVIAFWGGLLALWTLVQLLFEPPDRGDLSLKLVALAHYGLRGVGVVPEVGVLGAGVQLGETGLGGIPVKDASSAVRPTA